METVVSLAKKIEDTLSKGETVKVTSLLKSLDKIGIEVEQNKEKQEFYIETFNLTIGTAEEVKVINQQILRGLNEMISPAEDKEENSTKEKKVHRSKKLIGVNKREEQIRRSELEVAAVKELLDKEFEDRSKVTLKAQILTAINAGFSIASVAKALDKRYQQVYNTVLSAGYPLHVEAK